MAFWFVSLASDTAWTRSGLLKLNCRRRGLRRAAAPVPDALAAG
jgi:hypothetical protein